MSLEKKVLSFEQFQLHSERIKDFLDSQGWYYKGSGANYGYIYRNDAPEIIVQNVGNTFTASGSSITIPASAYNENCLLYVADSESTIATATVDGGGKISVNDIEITILGKTSGDTINLQLGNNPAQAYSLS